MINPELTLSDTFTYVANAPSDGALLARGRSLVRLALDAQVHDVVTADGAIVHDDIYGFEKSHFNALLVQAEQAPRYVFMKALLTPSPQSNSVPLTTPPMKNGNNTD